MGLIYRPETSIHSSRRTLRNNLEEQSTPDDFRLLELQILDSFDRSRSKLRVSNSEQKARECGYWMLSVSQVKPGVSF